jgi:hypothetical protein
MPEYITQQSTMQPSKKRSNSSIRKPSRKRVRFDAGGDEKRVKVQVVELIRPSSEMTNSERDSTWYQKSHYKENLLSVKVIAHEHARCNNGPQQPNKLELDYSGALASTYASCCTDASEDSTRPDHCAQYLAVVSHFEKCSVEGECNRGLERITVPVVGRETVRRRKEAIAMVVTAQHALKQCFKADEGVELLRRISEEQTRPARKFAKALGKADSISALLEYQASMSQPQHSVSFAPRHIATARGA